jgi:hypothetical protein
VKILALDLGTKTGWALSDNGQISSGTWKLATEKELDAARESGRDRTCDPRVVALFEKVKEVAAEVIYFEDVQFLSTQLQTQLWASLRAAVWLAGWKSDIHAVNVSTLKKLATGKGNATKGMMAAALPTDLFRVEKFDHKKPLVVEVGTGRKVDDNETDAWHLLQVAIKECKSNT